MKAKRILISQPAPTNGSSPYTDLITKYKLSIDFVPFFKVEPLQAKEFRLQKINILDHTAVVFTAKTAIDAFFKICEEMRITVPETMKYFCNSESIALYLQKYIVYRKRKIFFGNGTNASIIDAIGTKHKNENFLVCVTDSSKADIHKIFVKAKLKHTSGVFVKTVFSDLSNLELNNYDMLVFYSPSDIRSLKQNFPDFKPNGIQFATFGPATLKALKGAKLTSTVIAPTPEAPSIAKALSIYFEQK
ncbi:MAG TPA: uroporphyrinogen-III synthase [Bacteroidales bacterium]|nr:uroporphyrinogen-III synthase [Bacteroidales bacterium]HRR49158.1 uroporphyrinogen-III synthase [Bacteroidales bacterium]HRT34399.1 uroporphyrinogen-III synthase [Bacteroidales bacterium]